MFGLCFIFYLLQIHVCEDIFQSDTTKSKELSSSSTWNAALRFQATRKKDYSGILVIQNRPPLCSLKCKES